MKKNIQQLWRSPWIVACTNMLLMMVIYSLSRLFFYLVNKDLYPQVSDHLSSIFLGGTRFDLTALLYINSLYLLFSLLPLRIRGNELYQRIACWTFYIPNTLGLLVNAVDMAFIRYRDKRLTLDFFHEFAGDDNLLNIFCQSMVQYWYVTLFAIASVVLMVLLFRKHWEVTERPLWLFYGVQSILFVVSVYFIVIGIRGGFGAWTRPITLSNALQYTRQPNEAAIVLNTPFSLMLSSGTQGFIDPQYFNDDEMETIYTPVHAASTADRQDSARIGKNNVVVIILESFSKEYVGFYNKTLDGGKYVGYTPFLDSLLEHSASFQLSMASGRKSIDAMPSVLSSIPMLIEPYVLTPYSTNHVQSLASCLTTEGYTSAFFHGAPNSSMGFQAYARSAGFANYYGMDDYSNKGDFDGTWAIWDEPWMQFFANKMSEMQEPFCAALFTASSHHPFRIPEAYEGRFNKGTQPIHQCIGYTDLSLRHFFETAQNEPWFNHTLFVFSADHTNQVTFPEYNTAKGLYEIPIFFYSPSEDLQCFSNDSVPVSQVDIMPSVLAYLGYNKSFVSFGENVLTSHKNHPYAINYNHPIYQIFSNHLLLQFDGNAPIAIYDYVSDPLLQNNRIEELIVNKESQDMLRYLKAYIQQYIERMRENRMSIDK